MRGKGLDMTTARVEPIESHDIHSERLMRHAEEKLRPGFTYSPIT